MAEGHGVRADSGKNRSEFVSITSKKHIQCVRRNDPLIDFWWGQHGPLIQPLWTEMGKDERCLAVMMNTVTSISVNGETEKPWP